ncbi:MAG: hypothetical protein KA712_07875 [Myxococcales bacterium]|nr:hypothetical protein [Myxococcales bacterium]
MQTAVARMTRSFAFPFDSQGAVREERLEVMIQNRAPHGKGDATGAGRATNSLKAISVGLPGTPDGWSCAFVS